MTPSTKPGQHGTLYRYRIDYTPDPTPGATTGMEGTMIHAMMSTGQRRYGAVRGADMVEFGTWAEGAESEARRVLAVAEPRTTAWSDDGMIELPSCHGYTAVYAQLGAHGVADVGAILAEALSAFVGAPDPAEYLAGVRS